MKTLNPMKATKTKKHMKTNKKTIVPPPQKKKKKKMSRLP